MVRATIREARKPGTGKTETRRLLYTDRVAKNGIVPNSVTFLQDYKPDVPKFGHYWTLSKWQRVRAGDQCWVRENFYVGGGPEGENFGFAADLPSEDNPRLTPCIHMPHHLSRLTLIVTATKIQRLQDITEDDARAEGVEPAVAGVDYDGGPLKTYRTGFVRIWGALHGPDSWLSNPWVMAVSFRPILANIDAI